MCIYCTTKLFFPSILMNSSAFWHSLARCPPIEHWAFLANFFPVKFNSLWGESCCFEYRFLATLAQLGAELQTQQIFCDWIIMPYWAILVPRFVHNLGICSSNALVLIVVIRCPANWLLGSRWYAKLSFLRMNFVFVAQNTLMLLVLIVSPGTEAPEFRRPWEAETRVLTDLYMAQEPGCCLADWTDTRRKQRKVCACCPCVVLVLSLCCPCVVLVLSLCCPCVVLPSHLECELVTAVSWKWALGRETHLHTWYVWSILSEVALVPSVAIQKR